MNNIHSITKWAQRHLLTVPTFGHAVMVACAVASFDNVRSFFAAIHATGLIATGLGVAIGAALVMAAGLLSGMGNDWRNPRFQLVAAVTTLLALLSGGVQAAAYAMHGLHWLPAVGLGLSLPVVGELGVSLAVAAYEQEQKAKRLAAADDQVEERINSAVDLALSDINMEASKRDIEAAARKIVKSKLDALLARRVGNVGAIGNEEPTNPRQIADYAPESLPLANQERQRLAAERQRAICDLIAAYGPLSTTEIVQRLQDDRSVTASERTIRSDCATLEATGELVKDGRKWALQMTLIAALPEPALVHTNGVAH